MVTLANLRSQSSRDLAQLAKTTGVTGWHQMRKEQLVQAILKLLKKQRPVDLGSLSADISRQTVSRTSGSSVPRTNGKANGYVNSQKAPGKSTEKATASRVADQSQPMKSNGRKNEKVNGNGHHPKNSKSLSGNPKSAAISKSAVTPKSVTTPSSAVKSGVRSVVKTSDKVNGGIVGGAKNGVSKHPVNPPANGTKSHSNKTGAAIANGNDLNPRRAVAGKLTNGNSVTPSAIATQIQNENDRREELKNLALSALVAKENRTVEKDRLILIVRDSHWLQTYWEITEATIRRARAALEKNWRGAKPVLRLIEIVDEGDGPSEVVRREIEIHSGVDTWYIDSGMPSHTYRVMIGYLTSQGRFFALAKSNKVTTPSPGTPAPQDHWADIANHYESYFAMSGGFTDDNETRDLQDVFEEKLRRPVKALSSEHARMIDHRSDFRFEVDAQMVIFGIADPGAVVSVGGEPLRIEENGTFSIRVDMPDKRQVFPVVACSRDGAHQRTTVLAIERNTKVMDPVHMECDDT